MINDLKTLKHLYTSKNEHFLFVDFDFYKRWKILIKILMFLNKNYISCEIFRKKYKIHRKFVVVGLKWSGKNVKRGTTGFAKEYLQLSKNPKCIYCETQINAENATTDHIIPISTGGNNCQVNLMVCCNKCNNERGNIEFNRYLKLKNPKYKNVRYPFV